MPGSENALEELMCLIVGHLVQKGVAAKIADDLYLGSTVSWSDLLDTWSEVLQTFNLSNLRVSAPKTVIGPKQTIILGWHWSMGNLTATSHKVSTLVTCPPPSTVKALRSFLGAYRMLSQSY